MKGILNWAVLICIFAPCIAYSNSWDDLTIPTSPPPPPPICKDPCLCITPMLSDTSKYNSQTIKSTIRAAAKIDSCLIQQSLEAGITHEDNSIQLTILEILSGKPELADFTSLHKATTDDSLRVQQMALYVLAKKNCDSCLVSILDTFSNEERETHVRVLSARLLGEARYTEGKKAYKQGLLDKDNDVAIQSAITLAKIDDSSGLWLLYETSQNKSSGEGIRIASIKAIEFLSGMSFGYYKKYNAPVTEYEKKIALIKIKTWFKKYRIDLPEGENNEY